MNKALFLDRDGIINVDHGYVYKPEEFEFTPEIFDICKKAQELDFKIFVITNQSGIARGYFNEQDFEKLSHWMVEQFKQKNIVIEEVFYCPHHPTKGNNEYVRVCDCRKPAPGLIFQAQKKYNIDLQHSVFLGDKVSDMKAANNAGIKRRILLVGQYGDDSQIEATRVTSLNEVIAHL